MIKDRGRNALTGSTREMERWKEKFEEPTNEENVGETGVKDVMEQEVVKIGRDEVRKTLKMMKSERELTCGGIGVLEIEKMLGEWERSVLVSIFKKKRDV